jgi:hypothetical protein
MWPRMPSAYPRRVTTPDSPEERVDAVATPMTVESRAMIPNVRISIRHHYSSRLLWTAQHHAELSGQIERKVAGKAPFSSEHTGYVLSSIIASVAFLEAMINELFQDAADGHAPPDGFITPLTEECRRTMAEVWAITRGGRVRALEKFDSLLRSAGSPLLDRESDMVKDAEAAIDLRNRLIHFRPEDRSVDDAHAMERIRGKFTDNALMAGSGNAWWPDHALGYGAAVWAHRSVKALADHVSDAIGIEPNYRKVETTGWFGTMPGEHEL